MTLAIVLLFMLNMVFLPLWLFAKSDLKKLMNGIENNTEAPAKYLPSPYDQVVDAIETSALCTPEQWTANEYNFKKKDGTIEIWIANRIENRKINDDNNLPIHHKHKLNEIYLNWCAQKLLADCKL